jgi:hypothetical protein
VKINDGTLCFFEANFFTTELKGELMKLHRVEYRIGYSVCNSVKPLSVTLWLIVLNYCQVGFSENSQLDTVFF